MSIAEIKALFKEGIVTPILLTTTPEVFKKILKDEELEVIVPNGKNTHITLEKVFEEIPRKPTIIINNKHKLPRVLTNKLIHITLVDMNMGR